MREYEAIFIFRAEDELYAKGRELITGEFKTAKAKILKEDDMGSRELAYPIENETRGHYHLYEAEMEPEKLESITQSIKLMEPVLKYLFVKK